MGKGHPPAENHPWKKWGWADRDRKERNKKLREENPPIFFTRWGRSRQAYLNRFKISGNNRKRIKVKKELTKLDNEPYGI